jgi:hypothetical protein
MVPPVSSHSSSGSSAPTWTDMVRRLVRSGSRYTWIRLPDAPRLLTSGPASMSGLKSIFISLSETYMRLPAGVLPSSASCETRKATQ